MKKSFFYNGQAVEFKHPKRNISFLIGEERANNLILWVFSLSKSFPCCDLFSFNYFSLDMHYLLLEITVLSGKIICILAILHHLVKLTSDTAYANDPRIKKFAEERKQRKLQDKKAKEEAAKEKERVGILFCMICFEFFMIQS